MTILIPSCNRADMCLNLVNKIQGIGEIHIFVNNCDFMPYLIFEGMKNIVLHNWTHISGEPKLCHNRTLRKMLAAAPDHDILILEDDVDPLPFFRENYEFIFGLCRNENQLFTLSPIYIPEKKCHYTDAPEKEYNFIGWTLLTQRYVDGNFGMTKEVLKLVKKALAEYKFPVMKSTSGVCNVLSKVLHKERVIFYCAFPTLVEHGKHDSIQFPEGRKRVPLIAKK